MGAKKIPIRADRHMRLVERIREVASEEEAPGVKKGAADFRRRR
jgi:hypothetical protein